MSLYDKSDNFNAKKRFNPTNFDVNRNIYNKGLNYDERIRNTLKSRHTVQTTSSNRNTKNSFNHETAKERPSISKVNVFKPNDRKSERSVIGKMNNTIQIRNSAAQMQRKQIQRTNTYDFEENNQERRIKASHKSSNPIKRIPIFKSNPYTGFQNNNESERGRLNSMNGDSVTIKRGTSPLLTNINNKLKSRDNSIHSNINSFKQITKEEKKDRLLKLRDAEIESLKKEIKELRAISMQRLGNKSHQEFAFQRLQDELNTVIIDKEILEGQNIRLKEQLKNQKHEYKKKLFDIKLAYEKNARDNMLMMERELVFKYANDDNASIKMLKDQIEGMRG